MILLEDDLSDLLPFEQVSTTVRIILQLISFRQFSYMIYFIYIDQLPTSVAS